MHYTQEVNFGMVSLLTVHKSSEVTGVASEAAVSGTRHRGCGHGGSEEGGEGGFSV